MDELQQQLATLKGEIQLAERQLRSLQKELEALETTKQTATREYTFVKKQRSQDIERLTNEGKRLQVLCHAYSKAYEDLEQEVIRIKAEKTEAIRKAAEEVEAVYVDAKRAHGDAEAHEQRVKDKDSAVIVREKECDRRSIELDAEAKKNLTALEAIGRREENVHKEEIAAKTAVADAQHLLDDIDRQTKEKRMELQNLDIIITRKTRRAELIGVEAEAVLKRANSLVAETERKEELLNARDIEQNKREIQLNDKSATIRRAYSETLQRGGKLN